MHRIDAHQHFWRIDRGDYGWLNASEHPDICRDFLPADLAPLLERHGIDKTILVQAAPTFAETEFLLEIAASTPFVAGVVGWVDLTAADAPSRIERLARHDKLVGLRPMLQDIPDVEWMLRPDVATAVDAMARCGLRFDALVLPKHLPVLGRFLDRHPELPVVIDHGAKPDIVHGALKPWAEALRAIAQRGNTFCKLSGLASEAGPGWTTAQLAPYIESLVECFGPRRLMWGSDWPVLNEVGRYDAWLDAAASSTTRLSQADQALVYAGNAAHFYGITQV
jgi:L-fuconolactonase